MIFYRILLGKKKKISIFGKLRKLWITEVIMRALILPSVAVTSLAVQTGGRVDAGELGDRGRGAGERWAAGCRPRRHSRRQSRLKGGPHARAASASSEAPSTFSAAEERHSFLFFWSKTKIPTARTDLKNLAFLQVSLINLLTE